MRGNQKPRLERAAPAARPSGLLSQGSGLTLGSHNPLTTPQPLPLKIVLPCLIQHLRWGQLPIERLSM